VIRQVDDGYVVVGATDKDDTGDGLVMKVDNTGNEIWSRTFPNAAFEGLWITSDSGYIVSGWKEELVGTLIKLDEEGNIEWENTYGGPEECQLIQCQETTDGGYIASGYYNISGGDGWLIKTDENGTELWSKTYGPVTTEDCFHSIHQTNDNGYILPGWNSNWTELSSDGWVVKTDRDGIVEWEKTFDTGDDIILGIDKIDQINMGRQDLDGGYIFTGWAAAAIIGDKGKYWLLKTDENGDLEWEQTVGKPWFHDLGLWIEPTSDGGYIAAGKRYGLGTLPNLIFNGLGMPIRNQLWVIKTDSEGNIEWDLSYKDATARCVQETDDGGYIIAGHKGPYYGTKGILLIKIDSDGNY
jgi:hypothetical protein